jgi:hypothetical protein
MKIPATMLFLWLIKTELINPNKRAMNGTNFLVLSVIILLSGHGQARGALDSFVRFHRSRCESPTTLV